MEKEELKFRNSYRVMKELNKDKAKLKEAFRIFCDKYGNDIYGFEIGSLNGCGLSLLKISIDKISEELESDKNELREAFRIFNEKYSINIVAYSIYRKHKQNWILDEIVMNGKLFR